MKSFVSISRVLLLSFHFLLLSQTLFAQSAGIPNPFPSEPSDTTPVNPGPVNPSIPEPGLPPPTGIPDPSLPKPTPPISEGVWKDTELRDFRKGSFAGAATSAVVLFASTVFTVGPDLGMAIYSFGMGMMGIAPAYAFYKFSPTRGLLGKTQKARAAYFCIAALAGTAAGYFVIRRH